MMSVYAPILLHLAIVVVIAMAMVALGFFFGRRTRSVVKSEPYESGIRPKTAAQQRFDVKFYLVAILFIVFDLETTYLYPWAVIYKELAWFGFFEMLVFVFILMVGYLYIVKKGALDWD